MFRDVDTAVLDRIAALAVTRRARIGEVLFLKGDEPDALYGVISGQVQISTRGPRGRTLILNIMGPGKVFGEIALVDGMPRTADAVAVLPTQLVVIGRADFVALLRRETSLTTHLLNLVCQRVRQTTEQVEDLALLSAPARLAKRLLVMADVEGDAVSGGVRVRLQPSQSELGHMLGVSRVWVNRHLQRWQKNGWISLSRGYVTILDRQALESLIPEEWD